MTSDYRAVPEGYLIVPDIREHAPDMSKITSPFDAANALADALARMEQDEIIQYSLKKNGYEKKRICLNVHNEGFFQCSECGCLVQLSCDCEPTIKVGIAIDPKYCPNCGAKVVNK